MSSLVMTVRFEIMLSSSMRIIFVGNVANGDDRLKTRCRGAQLHHLLVESSRNIARQSVYKVFFNPTSLLSFITATLRSPAICLQTSNQLFGKLNSPNQEARPEIHQPPRWRPSPSSPSSLASLPPMPRPLRLPALAISTVRPYSSIRTGFR